MSTLSVSQITTSDNTTPLLFTTGNASSGFIKVQSANDEILFSGTPRFTGSISGVAPTAAFTTANLAYTQANSAYDQSNTATTIGQSAYDQANTATTIGQSAFGQANTATTIGQAAFGQANTATTIGQAAFGQANTATTIGQAAFTQANTATTIGQAAFTQANTVPLAASQADQETATSTTTYVSPGRQHFHPSAAKFWAHFGVTGNLLAGYNVTSITDNGPGVATVVIATDFSTGDYCVGVSIENLDATIDSIADGQISMIANGLQAAGSVQVLCKNDDGTAAADPTTWNVWGFGDQA